MAIFKSVSRTNALNRMLQYADKDRRANEDYTLTRGINCSDYAEIALKQMEDVKHLYHKEGGREYQQYILSFKQGEITKEQAIEYAYEHANECFGSRYQVFVGVHLNSKSGCIHAHYVVNSVSFVDGRKIQSSPLDYEIYKHKNDEIAKMYGLEVIDRSPEAIAKRNRPQIYRQADYQMQGKIVTKQISEESYKLACYNVVTKALEEKPETFKAFVDSIKAYGWIAVRRGRHIVFHKDMADSKVKVRANTLAKMFHDNTVNTGNILKVCNESNYKDYIVERGQARKALAARLAEKHEGIYVTGNVQRSSAKPAHGSIKMHLDDDDEKIKKEGLGL